jgi:hypothetical protein
VYLLTWQGNEYGRVLLETETESKEHVLSFTGYFMTLSAASNGTMTDKQKRIYY